MKKDRDDGHDDHGMGTKDCSRETGHNTNFFFPIAKPRVGDNPPPKGPFDESHSSNLDGSGPSSL